MDVSQVIDGLTGYDKPVGCWWIRSPDRKTVLSDSQCDLDWKLSLIAGLRKLAMGDYTLLVSSSPKLDSADSSTAEKQRWTFSVSVSSGSTSEQTTLAIAREFMAEVRGLLNDVKQARAEDRTAMQAQVGLVTDGASKLIGAVTAHIQAVAMAQEIMARVEQQRLTSGSEIDQARLDLLKSAVEQAQSNGSWSVEEIVELGKAMPELLPALEPIMLLVGQAVGGVVKMVRSQH